MGEWASEPLYKYEMVLKSLINKTCFQKKIIAEENEEKKDWKKVTKRQKL